MYIFSESKDPDAYLANPLSCYVGNSDNALWNFLEDAFMNDEIEEVIIDLIAPLAAEIIYSLLVPEQLFKPVRTIRGLLRGAHSFASFHDTLRLTITLYCFSNVPLSSFWMPSVLLSILLKVSTLHVMQYHLYFSEVNRSLPITIDG